MSKSTYKKYMTESFLYEDEDFKARSKESGKIIYYKSKDAMDAAIKDKKAEPIEKDDKKDDKPDTKKGMDIDTTGGLGGDDKPKDKPKGERPATIHLDYDQADDDLDSLR